MKKTSRRFHIALMSAILSFCFIANSVSAGTISGFVPFGAYDGTGPGISAGPNGLGDIQILFLGTFSPNADDTPGTNISIPVKRFSTPGYIDIVFTVDTSLGVTEYAFSETVDNDTTFDWSSYTMQLGYYDGGNFVLSDNLDGLDFDADSFGNISPGPTSGAFSNVYPLTGTAGNELFFNTGIHSSGSQIYTFNVDVPNGISEFVLRQFPTAVPEPGTIGLGLIGLVGLGFAARRRKVAGL